MIRRISLISEKSLRMYFLISAVSLLVFLRSKMAFPSACFLALRNLVRIVLSLAVLGPFISQTVPSINKSGFLLLGMFDGIIVSTSKPKLDRQNTVASSCGSKLWLLKTALPYLLFGTVFRSIIFIGLILPCWFIIV